ncbi:SusC/RagA family TonB-linked outer membrane protein [Chryseobacterium sp. G0186]|uniref:SusC/RagA family TonB-linked outer membrane protein n=1 Tax=Chryseobacterium sp. G0186 TaxID=2487064 RepID=UPI000F4E6DA9|nr:SusC/RagA family TonB-linked outer membrane protein [Chryseobacterium sp. G0186]AZA77506.1 SusC/RagA family TonB-linked outer membrane protein [Chryseobacterium sp. G0186]
MNIKLHVLSAGVLFFLGQTVSAQKVKKDTTTTKIDEVVVVAFGKQKKEAIVGSVSVVDEKTIQTQQAPSVLSALQGSVAGLNLISSGGQPGTNPTIYIRGIGSLNGSTDPLIVVDGIPYNGNINNISQDQVESMSVLKDASSTVLYGSRASNGVILITTKKGKLNSAPKVTLTSLSGVSAPAVKLHKTLGAADFMKYSWQAIRNNEQYTNGLTASDAGVKASNSLIPALGYNPYNINNPIDANGNLVPGANLLWDTDWEKEILNKAAFKHEHRFTLQGGSDKTTYFLAADYLDLAGSVRSSNFERIGLRLNVDSNVTQWLKVGMNGAFTTSTSSDPSQSGNSYTSSIQWIYTMPSIYPLYMRNSNGGLLLDDFGQPQYDYGNNGTSGQLVNAQRSILNNENAVGALYNNKNIIKRSNFTINAYAQINFTKDLNLKSQIGYEQYLLDQNAYSHYKYGAAGNVGGRVAQDRDLSKTINFTNGLNYSKKMGDHGIDAQALFEVYQFTYDALGAQGIGFLPNVYVLNGSTKPESVTGYVSQERMFSYLGRLAYNYKNKYFLEGSFRSDGSTRFSEETRWGSFYSVGGSWVVSKEEFFKNDIFNYLKLRGSYGELGNNKILNSDDTQNYFPYLSLYEVGWNQLGQTGVLLGNVVDHNLSWEKTASTNVGLDFGFFNNRITGTVEYFNKKSIDLIYSKPIPESTGFSTITTNVGSLRNYGWEFLINSTNFKNEKFVWTTSLNFSFIKNRITEMTQESFINGTKRWMVGKSAFDFYLPVWAGVDSADGMGMWYLYEKDGNGNVINTTTTKDYNLANAVDNRQYVGSSLPDIFGGLTNYFKIGNFDLNVLANFSFGGHVYDSSYASLMSGFSSGDSQQSVDVMNAWQKPGDVTGVPININKQNNNNALSTRFLYKNDYVRLKSLTLGYNIDPDLLTNFGINQFRIFLQGDNLWTWQSHKGIDPEQNISGTTDSRSYILKTMSLGVTVGF